MVRLYSYWRSSCSWRVRFVLAAKNVSYDYVPIHLVKGEQHSDDYVKLNSMHEVPALELDDGTVLTQSIAILEYLEEAHPENALLPTSAVGKAQVRGLVNLIACDIQPVQNLRVLKRVASEFGDEHKGPWGRWVIENGFDALEKELTKTAGKYCYGDSLTFADACLLPQIYNARRFKVDMDKYPTIARVETNLKETKEYAASCPESQPDFDPNA